MSLTHDDNGNLTVDPTAWNVDDTTGPSGQGGPCSRSERGGAILLSSRNALVLTLPQDLPQTVAIQRQHAGSAWVATRQAATRGEDM